MYDLINVLTILYEWVMRDENAVHCIDILIDRQFYKLSIVYKRFFTKPAKCGPSCFQLILFVGFWIMFRTE